MREMGKWRELIRIAHDNELRSREKRKTKNGIRKVVIEIDQSKPD